MIISMISLNEEKFVDLCIREIHDLSFVTDIRVVDGGSTDLTVHKLNQYPKVKVFHHFYDQGYHDAQIMQRQIALSYIPNGEVCFILDFDERMSDDLKSLLERIDREGMPHDTDMVCVSRRSYDSMRYPKSPYAMVDKDGWPVKSKQIGQYPDFQPRLIRKRPGMVWINSPHHSLTAPDFKSMCMPDTDIIHYHGKFDDTQRQKIEIIWAKTQARRKELGLICDLFDARLDPTLAKYADPETWSS
jgi:glycosyltransferase involved in cell wall biosynthesis